MSDIKPDTIQVTAEYGRKLSFDAEWLDDLPQEVDEIMAQPLRVGDDCRSGFSPFAFCAPEVIRGAVTCHILRTSLDIPCEPL